VRDFPFGCNTKRSRFFIKEVFYEGEEEREYSGVILISVLFNSVDFSIVYFKQIFMVA
jgi:hypothetical protein